LSKREKKEDSIRKNQTNVSIEDFEALIRRFGFIREGGRHPKAIIGKRVFPYRRTNPVHRVYVEKILEIMDDLYQQEDE
jgi:hypothetical protein